MITTEILSQIHRKLKNNFACGKILPDTYLKTQAAQDIKRKLCACFVSVDNKTGLIQGYYTLSSNSIPIGIVPDNYKKQLPYSYSSIPAILLGRLAVDSRFKGLGIGKMLLIDALSRSYEISKSVGSFAVVVDPLDEEAEKFYFKYGFILLPDSRKMFLPMKTIGKLF
ncbi:MAG: GNAT family N-acetyltransferase [Bacteroidia bacterium]|nr:GNAT family N-acetyltransferase [Bacteroidia bacterium]